MIDEKRLIEVIEKNFGYTGGASVMKQLIKMQPKVNEWIPIDERLPEDNQVVLTIKNNHISILEYHAKTKHWFETKGNWWWSFNMVDAWMPLPEPYKKVEE